MQTIFQAYILAIELIAIYMLGMFVISLIKKDNSIVDTAYGIGFVLVAFSTLLKFGTGGFVQVLVSTLIAIWGLRLATRIYLRNRNKPEDFRYKKWREEWKWFKTRSFFQIYVLQGAIIVGISSVSIITNSSILTGVSISGWSEVLLVSLGFLIWLTGFIFESVGDYQLDQFIKRQSKAKAEALAKGEEYKPEVTIMSEGLWSLTRHPNYFGEVSMWWGLWLIACSVPFGYLTIVSPLIITYLLLKVSGIPMLEKKYEGNTEYKAYQERTNAFFPFRRVVKSK
jgi:steroid 5-alpha reductase family enzyme